MSIRTPTSACTLTVLIALTKGASLTVCTALTKGASLAKCGAELSLLIVLSSFIFILQHIVRFANIYKDLLRIRTAFVDIRMILLGFLFKDESKNITRKQSIYFKEGFLDLCRCRSRFHTKNIIVILPYVSYPISKFHGTIRTFHAYLRYIDEVLLIQKIV